MSDKLKEAIKELDKDLDKMMEAKVPTHVMYKRVKRQLQALTEKEELTLNDLRFLLKGMIQKVDTDFHQGYNQAVKDILQAINRK